jgi:hypothetical protein
VRGGEVGAGVGAVDNGGALIAPFIRSWVAEGMHTRGWRQRRWNFNDTGYGR